MKSFPVLRKLIHYLNLESEVDDFEKIHDSILRDIIFKGTNLWILIFAILVASVGLNMNSTAVIIGAMLISPLMGPINGIGYSIATYNFPLFKNALKNLGFAVLSSLAASTLYFTITPISSAHSELLARTSPSIYDVLIALFGGFAGIVAIASRQKGNVIPGVAIATALMPPLCTAGYGLATAQFAYFFGALYLFTINAVFIAISAMLISQILNFPIRTIVDSKQKKRINGYISFVIALVFIPSLFFGYKLVQKERFLEKSTLYVRNISIFEGNYLLNHEINPDKRTIKLIFGGSTLTETQKVLLKDRADDFDLTDVQIEFQQGLSFDLLTTRNIELENLQNEIRRLNDSLERKDLALQQGARDIALGRQLLSELKMLYPQIAQLSYAQSRQFDQADPEKSDILYIVLIDTKGQGLSEEDQEKVRNWLKARLQLNRIRLYID